MSAGAADGPAPKVMSSRAVRSLLSRNLIASLATVDASGAPHVVPIWFRRDGDHLLFPTSSRTKKARNLTRNPRAAAMIHDGSGMNIFGLMLRGRVDIIEGDEARRLNRSIHLRYVSARDLKRPDIGAYLGGDDVTLRLRIEQVVSWDMSGFGKPGGG
jgi:PPOX class probable F420-dependent enzyme